MGIGTQLKKILNEKGITIKELSELSGISVNTLYAITKRDSTGITPQIKQQLADALSIDPLDLLIDNEQANQIINSRIKQEDAIREGVTELYGPFAWELLTYFKNLTSVGKIKVLERAAELEEIPKYNAAYQDYLANSTEEPNDE